jgi:hypothetical protein
MNPEPPLAGFNGARDIAQQGPIALDRAVWAHPLT